MARSVTYAFWLSLKFSNLIWQLVRFTSSVRSSPLVVTMDTLWIATQSASPSPFTDTLIPRVPPVAAWWRVILVMLANGEVTALGSAVEYSPVYFRVFI